MMKDKLNSAITTVFHFLVVVVLLLAFIYVPVYIVGSALTSVVKVANDDCAKSYTVEWVVNGDWFCPGE